ncbi:MAG: class I SAM-dependent methyltransferase [Chthoniobacterales bacterium]
MHVQNNPAFIPEPWDDYELLDSGDGMKRERWGNQILIRPEVAAYWPRRNPRDWEEWNGWFHPSSNHHQGSWKWKTATPEPWILKRNQLRFFIHPTSSKQVGLFPEQAINWDWCVKKIKMAERPVKLLNLFGYTGAASIATAAAGASVCHVDASKAMVSWCSQNATASGLAEENKEGNKVPIRFIVDDCTKFIARELRRGNRYDAIILDPPSFGRGGSGTLWKIEDQLLSLLTTCKNLLSEQPLFLMMSSYSASLLEAGSLLEEIFGDHQNSLISEIFLGLQGTRDGNIIPCGMTNRWEAPIQQNG